MPRSYVLEQIEAVWNIVMTSWRAYAEQRDRVGEFAKRTTAHLEIYPRSRLTSYSMGRQAQVLLIYCRSL